ncbi:hypothetical protein Bache_3265 [Bacteroides helcogenes P 36-108]|uniref:DUF4493 domain-containing protein n=1 Tax=Bacteroides helcogenes (strain ATCC 35417 / DSM 20613 / JCM 6297 / CCUG 15421 / P 36-108) TaxID=693979 RepID=E6SSD7_BACT6|nr:hypothetical protein Bache_3265 [Bacteroides helcogenes P 36-108]
MPLSLFFMACHNDEEPATESKGFLISLEDEVVDIASRSTPAEIGKPVADNFRLKITSHKTGGDIYNAAYTSKVIPASAGTYSLTASCGENAVLAWDSPYYEGIAEAEITTNKTTSVTIPCKVANSLLSITFTNPERFASQYSAYGVRVKIGEFSLNIEKENIQKSAYFRAGSVVELIFYGTLIDNGQQVSMPITNGKLPATYEAGTHTKLSLTAATPVAGTILTIDKVEVEKVTIAATIPMEWLPKPKVSGFNGKRTLEYTETADAPADAIISYNAYSPIQDIEFAFDFKDTQYTSYNKTYTLSALTDEERTALNGIGIALPTLDGSSTEGTIDLKALTENLQTNAGTEVVNTFKLRVKANNRWSSEEGESYTIDVKKPEFTVSVSPGNIWTKEFTMNALKENQVKTGNFDRLSKNMSYQCSTDGVNWMTLNSDLRKDGLKPNTSYYIRGVYRQAIPGETVKLKTYDAYQIPNSTLDNGYSTTYPKSKNPLYTFNEGWIGTRNPLTCHTSGVNAFYVSKSSTLPISDNNSTVAHMMTIGWGSGNTCSFGNKSGSVIYNISAGIVCVGDYNADNDNITAKEAFIRPTSLSFTYKAAPYNNDEYLIEIYLINKTEDTENIIGFGSMQSGATVSAYTTVPISIVYYDAMKEMPISHIKIIFKAGTKEDRDHLEDKFRDASVWNGYTNAYIVGSQFWLDSFTLNYDK